MPKPRLSVIVPAYNAAATVATTIRSLRRQTLAEIEVVAVDDGSTDSTAEVIREVAEGDPRIKLISQSNRGLSAARNAGIERAGAPYIGFLDSDDAWLPRYCELACGRLDATTDAGLAYADCLTLLDERKLIYRETSLQSYPAVGPDEEPEAFLEVLIRANFITASSVTVSRGALERVGGFSTDLNASEDWDLWLRIAAAGLRGILIDPEPLVLLRDTPTSMSKDAARMARSAAEVLKRTSEIIAPDSRARRLAEDGASKHEAEHRRLTHPNAAQLAAERLRELGRPAKRRLLEPLQWRSPTPEVRAELEALGEL